MSLPKRIKEAEKVLGTVQSRRDLIIDVIEVRTETAPNGERFRSHREPSSWQESDWSDFGGQRVQVRRALYEKGKD
jgi:hypothetical protein